MRVGEDDVRNDLVLCCRKQCANLVVVVGPRINNRDAASTQNIAVCSMKSRRACIARGHTANAGRDFDCCPVVRFEIFVESDNICHNAFHANCTAAPPSWQAAGLTFRLYRCAPDKYGNDQGEQIRNVSSSYYQNTGPYDRVLMAIGNFCARLAVLDNTAPSARRLSSPRHPTFYNDLFRDPSQSHCG